MNDSENLRQPLATASILDETLRAGFTMASEALTGSLLRSLACTKPGGSFLELGSGTGLSTAWILDGMDSLSRLTTVDHDEKLLHIVRRYLGDDPRLRMICSDGDDFVQRFEGEAFDMIFADTWPGKYRLLQETLALLKPGGMYVVDDMLPQTNWPEGHSEKAALLIATLEQLEGFHVTKLSWASGIILAVKQAA
jgi:predicted O-methyltransferase YrrM